MINHLRINLEHLRYYIARWSSLALRSSELLRFSLYVCRKYSGITQCDGLLYIKSMGLLLNSRFYYLLGIFCAIKNEYQYDVRVFTYYYMDIVFFILSNHYSTREWCCYKHIIYHGMSHILCFAGSLYAFLPDV